MTVTRGWTKRKKNTFSGYLCCHKVGIGKEVSGFRPIQSLLQMRQHERSGLKHQTRFCSFVCYLTKSAASCTGDFNARGLCCCRQRHRCHHVRRKTWWFTAASPRDDGGGVGEKRHPTIIRGNEKGEGNYKLFQHLSPSRGVFVSMYVL